MKLESQVCSLELAKKLKELGVKQESLFYHQVGIDKAIITKVAKDFGENEMKLDLNWYSAFTVAELGELLPDEMTDFKQEFPMYLYTQKCDETWYVFYQEPDANYISFKFEAETEADARAKMLIYLLENKLITTTSHD